MTCPGGEVTPQHIHGKAGGRGKVRKLLCKLLPMKPELWSCSGHGAEHEGKLERLREGVMQRGIPEMERGIPVTERGIPVMGRGIPGDRERDSQ